MRWLLTFSFLLTASPAFAQENEAEKIFRAMEKKILEAKALKIVFKGEGQYESKPFKTFHAYSGSALFTFENKSRIELENRLDPTVRNPLDIAFFVSDGKQIVRRIFEPSNHEPQKTPIALNNALVPISGRLGFQAMTMRLLFADSYSAEFEIDKEVAISNFKLGPKETSLPQSHAIEYIVARQEKSLHFKLWIDSVTLLPLKRQFTVKKEEGNERYLTETYTEFILNPQLDPKLFELPK